MVWKPSARYDKVAEANRRYYAATASLYDATETCVNDVAAQKTLDADLDFVVSQLGKESSALTALDACGGSGNVALKLLDRGMSVTICDISSDLLALFRSKLPPCRTAPRIVCSEIASFLATDRTTYDAIIFSSALHHLENIESVLLLALERLEPEGILFTTFDPTNRQALKAITRLVLRLDILAFKALHQPSDFPAAVLRRIRRRFANRHRDGLVAELSWENLGVLAEYHAGVGIDDLALVEYVQSIGFSVLRHDRYTGGRFAVTRRLLRWLGDVTSFKLFLRRSTC